jgi:Tfp pilus assembly protein FimV
LILALGSALCGLAAASAPAASGSGAVLTRPSAASAVDHQAARQGSVYTAQPGDTLWSIASSVGGRASDPRRVVDSIVSLNRLPGATIRPGERLALP